LIIAPTDLIIIAVDLAFKLVGDSVWQPEHFADSAN
jgi:hypothetical protein